MISTFLRRLFFKPKSTTDQFGEQIPPPAYVNAVSVRRDADTGRLELCIEGENIFGTASGPEVTIDGVPSPYTQFEDDLLVAQLPLNPAPKVRVIVHYGTVVAGDLLIRLEEGRRVGRFFIRIDDRY